MPDTPSYRAPLTLLPLIGIPVFLAIANQTMVSVALPDIGADLGEMRRLPLLVMGYMIALTVAGPLYGVLGDSYGRGRMMMIALTVYVGGTLISGTAQGLGTLALGRVVQGLGGGGLMSISQALIGDLVAPRDRGRAQGNIAAISVVASSLGPLLGGVMVETLGWRSLFLVTIPLALGAMAMLQLHRLPRHETRRSRFDTAGFFGLIALVIGITGAIELAAEAPLWAGLSGLVSLAGLATLLRAEPRAANAFFPPALFAFPAINRAAITVFCHGAALVSLVTTIPLFHAILRTDGAIATASTMLALTMAFGTAGVITGNLVTVTGRTVLFPAFALPVAIAMIAFIAIKGPDLARPVLIASYLVTGLFFGTVMSVMNTLIQLAAPDALRGRAAGLVTFARSIGAVVGTALISFVLFTVAPQDGGAEAVLTGAHALDPAQAEGWRAGFRAAFLTIAGIVTLEWLLILSNPLKRVD